MGWKSGWLGVGLVVCGVTAASSGPGAGVRFRDDSFQDFRAGTPGSGGQNLYAARDGSLRVINRFDLNDDGYLDLVYNCTHDTYQMLSATVGHMDARGVARSADLPVEGSQQAAIADLNRDGWTDVAFCPNSIGVDHPRRQLTIAWGGPGGWSSRRISTALPVNQAAGVAIPDLNADGWPDLAVLCGPRWLPNQPQGRIIRVYWGGSTGFDVTRFEDLGVAGAAQIAAGDFDGSGKASLAVLRPGGLAVFSPGGSVVAPWNVALGLPGAACLTVADLNSDRKIDLLVGGSEPEVAALLSRGGGAWSPERRSPALRATHLAAGDLDRDGHVDLVQTWFSENRAAGGEQAGAGKAAPDTIQVLWGATEGFDRARSTPIRLRAPVAAAIGDLNGDGHPDLVAASHQGAKTFNGASPIFLGDGKRGFRPAPSGFRTSGTTDVVVAPAERGLPARAVFCNSIGGRLEEAVPVPVFWGGPRGFDPQRALWIPFHSGYEASAADFDRDGRSDLLLLNSGHAGESAQSDKTLGANILFGGASGPDLKRRTIIRQPFLGTSTVADLDRDGELDLILEPFGPVATGRPDELFVYYGDRGRFPDSRRVTLEKDGYGQEHIVADLNGDGLLDIATTTRKFHALRIYWNSPKGFDAARDTRLPVSGPVGVDAADFNRDGKLDLLVGSYNDPVSGFKDMGCTLFWGSGRGYSQANSQWLPGFACLGRTIADYDGDGYLDLFSPQQSGELTREDLACRLYWGGPDGFQTRRFTTLFCDSVNDSMAGDFNGDDRIDIAVSCHTRHGDHRARSRVFYNDGKRFQSPRVQFLPTNGPHLMFATDVGNLFDRTYREHFESRVFRWERPLRRASVTVGAYLPPKSAVDWELRSAPSPDRLADAPWRPGKSGTTLSPGDRCAQYRLSLRSPNGACYPTVHSVSLELK